mmetsp:Transcript_19134/g.53271  ORF Transcript_19134/g.53271 Transcript_19134/m.53271 type:complete len:150 (+) Transcript_19134:3263-3712(+)
MMNDTDPGMQPAVPVSVMRELTIEGCAQYNAQQFLQKILYFFENPTGGNNFDAAARYYRQSANVGRETFQLREFDGGCARIAFQHSLSSKQIIIIIMIRPKDNNTQDLSLLAPRAPTRTFIVFLWTCQKKTSNEAARKHFVFRNRTTAF